MASRGQISIQPCQPQLGVRRLPVSAGEPPGVAAEGVRVPAESVELELLGRYVAAGEGGVAVNGSGQPEVRAGGARCTVSQSNRTGPNAVIMVLSAFGSPWVIPRPDGRYPVRSPSRRSVRTRHRSVSGAAEPDR
jgi:hypothetical protein